MQDKISIIGLGYVGLPLAVEFAKQYKVVGFDISKLRINQIQEGKDRTKELSSLELCDVLVDNQKEFLPNINGLFLSFNLEDIVDSSIYIITVPTPIDKSKRPDLSYLFNATEMVAKVLVKGDVVIYESTVYPGCTEEDCVPILQKISGLIYNQDFFCGYSPERISPGNQEKKLTKIKKVTSGSNP